MGIQSLPCLCVYVCVYVCVCVTKSCPVHNFVIPGWILKLPSRNVNHHETMCPTQDPGL